MALTDTHIEVLERYFDGTHSPEDQQFIDTEMAVNEAFRQEIANQQFLQDGFDALALDAWSQQMKGWESKHQSTDTKAPKSPVVVPLKTEKNFVQTPKIIVLMKKYWIAAALLLMASPLAFWYLSSSNSVTAESLFAEHFKAEEVQPYVSVIRSGGSTDGAALGRTPPETKAVTETEDNKLKVLLTSGVEAYNKKNYSDAVLYFEDYLKTNTNPNNGREIRFYMGVSYLAQNNTAKAKEIFKELSQQPFSYGFQPLGQSSEWYLALTLLKEGDIQQAKKRLNRIANEDKGHSYQKQAKEMLAKMEKHTIG